MNILYDEKNKVILGRHYLIEAGNVIVNKVIYRPTLEMFTKFYNIIKDKPWFSKYNFIVVGSFSNIMNNNKLWETWDVDLVITSNSKQLNYSEIKVMLNECSQIALEECSIYVDLFFNLDFDFSFLNENGLYKIWENEVNIEGLKGKYKLNILSHLLYIKRDNVVVTPWHKKPGKEIIKGLWKRQYNYPSHKHIKRLQQKNNNIKYDPPIDIKDFFK